VSDRKDKLRIKVKRAYDAPAGCDGQRVLVDRVWPRGLSKNELRLDGWAKGIAPSTALRKWFDHDPAKWNAFKVRYARELDAAPGAVDLLLAKARAGTLTLVYGAKDREHNNAVLLKAYLERQAAASARAA
jgi:uncharacterized protein YeaO (DUF488 family)